jgi:hypothetical protein
MKKFLFDETAFVGLMRAACIGVGGAVSSGLISVSFFGDTNQAKLAGVALAAFGGFIRAGEKNPPKE